MERTSRIVLFAGWPRIRPDLTWLLILPGGLWAIAILYVPILGDSLNPAQTWAVAGLAALLVALSLAGHTLAHVYAAKWVGVKPPAVIPLFLFCDAAQVWPQAGLGWQEIAISVAGPLLNLLLAGLSYLVWNAQLNLYLNISMPIAGIFNAWMAIINLAPAFPLDGGRITRLLLSGRVGRLAAPRYARRLGYALVAVQGMWGIFLIAQQDRFSWQIGIATIVMALLLGEGLIMSKASVSAAEEPQRARPVRPLRMVSGAAVPLVMLALAASLLMTNNGLEAPGVALSVESMVEIPAQYRHQPAGTFILTSVIQQSPIPAGFWLLGKVMPAINILPPEKPQPNQVSPQESAQQGFQMLDQSEITAVVVGMRLAGYNAQAVGQGAEVASVLADSPSEGILQAGDVVMALNGVPIQTSADLISQVKTLDPQQPVHLSVIRNQQKVDLVVKLMPPAQPGSPPRLGIAVQDAGFDFHLPIPVKIVPQKIVGGPSAGLMFTLTVYNLLNSTDLTGGRRIAGTGTISLDGSVGPIGGVQQKVAAAEAAGAVYFLSPAENYADALSVAHKIKVIKINTVDEAIQFLKSLPPA